jgi:hypothetical protein
LGGLWELKSYVNSIAMLGLSTLARLVARVALALAQWLGGAERGGATVYFNLPGRPSQTFTMASAAH